MSFGDRAKIYENDYLPKFKDKATSITSFGTKRNSMIPTASANLLIKRKYDKSWYPELVSESL